MIELGAKNKNSRLYKALLDRDMIRHYGEMISDLKNNTSLHRYLESESYNRAELIL